MATTRFSKPWPYAGIRLGATLSLWRRVYYERARVAPCTFLSRSRGRLRGSGVFEACRGFPAALCRLDWVLGAFCTRMVNVRFAWQAAGIVRAGRYVAGGRAGGVLPWGLGSGRVAHAHDFTRCDLRFAWQVWDFGCIDTFGKPLDGGSAWQAQ